MLKTLLVVSLVMWSTSTALAQPLHGHPQLAAFDPATYTLKFLETQCHWAPGENPIAPDATPIVFDLVHAMLGNSTLAHTHFGFDTLQCPPYLEITGPRTCNFSVKAFHTTGTVSLLPGNQEGIRDIVWDDPLMTGSFRGDPTGLVVRTGHMTLDPTLFSRWQTNHGWWSPFISVDTTYDNGDTLNLRQFIGFYSMIDPTAPFRSGGDAQEGWPLIASRCSPGSARHPNDRWGDNLVDITGNYLPVGPIDAPYHNFVLTAGYGGQLFGANFQQRADLDLHNHNGGVLLKSVSQDGDLNTDATYDPVALGAGTHKMALMRNQLSSEGNDAVNTLLVFDVVVGPSFPPPPPPPTCGPGTHLVGGICVPDPPPPPTEFWADVTVHFQRLVDANGVPQNRWQLCSAAGECFEIVMR